MEAGAGGDDLSSRFPYSVVSKWRVTVSRRYQHLLDKLIPHVLRRWIAFAFAAFIYIIRVWFIQNFYIVSYLLGVCSIHLLIASSPRWLMGPLFPLLFV
ncbi:hypothetical protein HHK36_009868 [Tetracentron sinense]|uniref:Uncharacterized protein n=1 Tax=Tetracentron sinense TaxID=13715 RepID=A0A835DHW3_TETSI|nr:hypothetical protein HHK36_009868 [Tetracentron sinense]